MKILSSLVVLLPLIAGLGLGATVVPVKYAKLNDRLLTASVGLLLFIMGLSLGAGPTLLEDLRQAGVQAVALTLAAVAGSVLVVHILARIFFREDKGQ